MYVYIVSICTYVTTITENKVMKLLEWKGGLWQGLEEENQKGDVIAL